MGFTVALQYPNPEETVVLLITPGNRQRLAEILHSLPRSVLQPASQYPAVPTDRWPVSACSS